MRRAFIFPFFIIFMFIPMIFAEDIFHIVREISDVNLEIPTIEGDVTIVDEYYGRINSTSVNYWGNYSYFLSSNLTGVFFVQKGGVHNHAFYHTQWDEKFYITKVTNVEYIEFNETRGQLLVHYGETSVEYSDNSSSWIPNRECPVCEASMHGYEFSAYSTALYWYCKDCRITIGEVL